MLNFGCLVGLADAADCTVTYGEGVTTITVADGKTVDIKDATDGTLAVVTALTGERQNDTLVKDGPGLLVFSQDISAFVGAVTIAEGRATVNHKAGLGKTGVSSGTVTVADGATLEIDNTVYNDGTWTEHMAFLKRPLVFGGFGPDGKEGAVTSKGGAGPARRPDDQPDGRLQPHVRQAQGAGRADADGRCGRRRQPAGADGGDGRHLAA